LIQNLSLSDPVKDSKDGSDPKLEADGSVSIWQKWDK